jgi:hypothetical protein
VLHDQILSNRLQLRRARRNRIIREIKTLYFHNRVPDHKRMRSRCPCASVSSLCFASKATRNNRQHTFIRYPNKTEFCSLTLAMQSLVPAGVELINSTKYDHSITSQQTERSDTVTGRRIGRRRESKVRLLDRLWVRSCVCEGFRNSINNSISTFGPLNYLTRSPVVST